jgi:hypothetical protein
VPAPSPLDPARRIAQIVLAAGLVIAAAGVVLVLGFDVLAGFAAVAAGVLVALGAERRLAHIAFLERRGRRAAPYGAAAHLLGPRSWLPFSRGSGGPMLGGEGDNLGDGGDDGSSA